jgi:hypothetical protein
LNIIQVTFGAPFLSIPLLVKIALKQGVFAYDCKWSRSLLIANLQFKLPLTNLALLNALLHVGSGVVNDMSLVRDLDIPEGDQRHLHIIETWKRSCGNTGPSGWWRVSDFSKGRETGVLRRTRRRSVSQEQLLSGSRILKAWFSFFVIY